MNNDENARPGGHPGGAEAGIDGGGSTRTAVRLDQIRTDGGTQIREHIDQATVAAYASATEDGDVLPPVTVFDDGEEKWLADGFHRYYAKESLAQEFISCLVVEGSLRDAILFAAGANGKHGLRRSNADKRLSVMRLLDDAEWGCWSNREIARQCAVSHLFVAGLRQEKEAGEKGRRDEEEGSGEGSKQPSNNQKDTEETSESKVKVATNAALTLDSEEGVATTGSATENSNNAEGSEAQKKDKPASKKAVQAAQKMAEIQTRVQDLESKLADLAQRLKDKTEENESLRRIVQADDKLAAAEAELVRLRERDRLAQERIRGLMGEKQEAVRAAKRWKGKYENLKKETGHNGGRDG